MSLLPTNRLLVFTRERLKIYSIPHLEETAPGEWIPVETLTEPLYDLPFDARWLPASGISNPFTDNRTTRFILCSQETVYALEIPPGTGLHTSPNWRDSRMNIIPLSA